MTVHLDAGDPLNADWTKAYELDLPGVTNADDLAAYLRAAGMTWDEFTSLPAYDRWVVLYPWIPDGRAALAALM